MKIYQKIILSIVIMATAAGVTLKFWPKNNTEWVKLKQGPIVEAIYGLSSVVSEGEFRLKPGVIGTIEKVWVKEGDSVKAGQPLIKLADQSVTKAPFSGTITAVPFKEGENVFPQIVILSLLDLDHLYLSMTLEQSAALRVRNGQEALLMFESQRNQKYTAKVSAIIPKEGQFEIHLSVEKLPPGILPGMTADTSVVVGNKSETVMIPLKAVKGFQVRFMESNKIQKKTIKLGIVSGEWAELLEPTFSDPTKVDVAVEISNP